VLPSPLQILPPQIQATQIHPTRIHPTQIESVPPQVTSSAEPDFDWSSSESVLGDDDGDYDSDLEDDGSDLQDYGDSDFEDDESFEELLHPSAEERADPVHPR
jgi:hypothetical protein